ncbi:hypothetical protein QE152_g9777 [Popillia japonica]|uniref:Uncharacterized protein n=1 Tax=Popillia japonica TaxID=7064 RepID=A0AAW1LXU1_POPJA
MRRRSHDAIVRPKESDIPKFITTVKLIRNLLDQLSSIVNVLGKIKVSGRWYVPKCAKDNYTENQEISLPQREQITFSNLRNVVLSLASADTPPIL